MAKYQDTVETLITARNEVAKELRAAEQQMKEQDARERKRVQEAEAFARQRAEVEQQIQQSALRSQGKGLEAQLAQVRNSYAKQVAVAKAAGQQELANRLEVLASLKQQEVRAAADRARAAAKASEASQRQSRRQQALDLLVGGGVAAVIDQLGRKANEIAVEAGKVFRQFQRGEASAGQIVDKVSQGVPVLGTWFQLGQRIREQFDGTAAAVEEANRQLERANAYIKEQEQLAANRKRILSSLGNTQASIQDEIDLDEVERASKQRIEVYGREAKEIEGFARRRLELQQSLNRELVEIERTIGSETNAELRKQAAEASRLAEVRFAIRREQLDSQEARLIRERDEQAQRERVEATAAANREIEDMRLRLSGRVLEADIAAIRQAAKERIKAAQDAGNRELVEAERTRARIREAEVRERAARERRIEEINTRRGEIAKEAEGLREQIQRAQSRNQAAPTPAADQNRFLTGVRQISEQYDRQMVNNQNRQIDLLKGQIAELTKQSAALEKIAQDLQKAPLIRRGQL